MIMYTVEYAKEARKALKAMPRNTAKLVLEKIGALAVDPLAPNNNVRKLTNHPGYRLRVGDWRVIYLLHEEVLIIAVVRIAPRGDAYQ
jgi:mRNA interferase RelE/StbE